MDNLPEVDAVAVFQSAVDAFKAGLPEDDRRDIERFQDPEKMIRSIKEKMQRESAVNTPRLDKFCDKINKFAAAMSPFFDILDIFVNTHPEWIGLFWGGLRLLFKLSSHYMSFVERIGAMFEEMTEALPFYKEALESFRTRQRAGLITPDLDRGIVKALSLVYTDILQFSLDVCKLFSRKRHGARFKPHVIGEMFWKPFDVRFKGIISRFQHHRQMLSREIRNKETHRFLTILKGIEENLADLKDKTKVPPTVAQETEAKNRREHLCELRDWIKAPGWEYAYNAARAQMLPGTGGWFLRSEIYQKWREPIFDLECDKPSERLLSERVLFFQAKPGFGKTVLCASMIEDLQSHFAKSRTHSRWVSSKGSVLYYFFDKQRLHDSTCHGALSALLTQALYWHQADLEFLDLASLPMTASDSAQRSASTNDLELLLHAYMQWHPNATICLDGIDECKDIDILLSSIHKILISSNCQLALTGRPCVDTWPLFMDQSQPQMFATNEENSRDIQKLVRSEMDYVFGRKLLGSCSISRSELEQRIAKRANSMFLWVSLLFSYLKSPALSTLDRLDAINNLQLLDGLDEMYTKILDHLRVRFAGRSWKNVWNCFELVAVAQRAYTPEELESALMILSGRLLRDKQTSFADFEKAIYQMSGALMEIGKDHGVRFIHASVLEYFTGDNEDEGHVQTVDARKYRIHVAAAHRESAITCLSYFLHNVTPLPLSGNSHISAHSSIVLQRYPLLSYAAVFWPAHVERGLDMKSDLAQAPSLAEHVRRLLSLLRQFIASKEVLSTWIESSWLFECPPLATGLERRLDIISSYDCEQAPGEVTPPLRDLLQSFSDELLALDSYWGKVLHNSPNEIWEPSITAFLKSEYWMNTREAEIKVLEPQEGPQIIDRSSSILIASQPSLCGTKVGTVRVWPSRSFVAGSQNANCDQNEVQDSEALQIPTASWAVKEKDVLDCSTGWTANYKVLSLEQDSTLVDIKFSLPEQDVQHHVRHFCSTGETKFNFPVSFASDLSQVALLGSVVTPVEGSDAPYTSFSVQSLNIARLLKGSSNYITSFSQTSEFFLFAIGPDTFQTWNLQIYQKQELNGSCQFRFLSELSQIIPERDIQLPFHPREPLIALASGHETKLWRFDPKSGHTRPLVVHKQSLSRLSFSDCGRYLHGYPAMHADPVIIDVHRHVNRCLPRISVQQEYSKVRGPNSTIQVAKRADHALQARAPTRPGIQQSGIVTIKSSEESTSISILRQDIEQGSITLQSLRENGEARAECLTRLPTTETLKHSFSTLLPSSLGVGEDVKILLNQKARKWYDMAEQPDFALPAVITRMQDSIPVVSGKRTLTITDGAANDQTLLRRVRVKRTTAPSALQDSYN